MLGLQGLDVLIGLALMMFVVSLAASTIVEVYASAIGKRGRDLRKALDGLVADISKTNAIGLLKQERAVVVRWMGKRFPSYVSPETFSDAVGELVEIQDWKMAVEGLNADEQAAQRRKDDGNPVMTRMARTARSTGGDPDAIRGAVDKLFEEAMDRLSGAYKRWAKVWLFGAGAAIAVIGNVSVFHAAQALWNDDTTRDAVVEAAQNVGSGEESISGAELESVAETVEQLEDIGIPVGWTDAAQAQWGDQDGGLWPTWGRLSLLVGWLSTAVLTTLGAPFWFDLLNKLISVRGSGGRPKAGESTTNDPDAGAAGLAAPNGMPVGDADEVGAAVRNALGV